MSGAQYLVSGPGTEGRQAPTVGAAISLAQTLACRATAPGTWYVRNPAGGIDYHVTRHENGPTLVSTAPASGHVAPAPVPREAAAKTTLKEALAA